MKSREEEFFLSFIKMKNSRKYLLLVTNKSFNNITNTKFLVTKILFF